MINVRILLYSSCHTKQNNPTDLSWRPFFPNGHLSSHQDITVNIYWALGNTYLEGLVSCASVMCSDTEWTCAKHKYKCFNRSTVDYRTNCNMTHLIIVILMGSETVMWWCIINDKHSDNLTEGFIWLQIARTLTVICFST